VQRLRSYLANPENMKILRGIRTDTTGLLDIEPKHGASEVVIPKPSYNMHMTLPLRVPHLNRNWSAGLFQKAGYVKGYYGSGKNRYRAVGLDFNGCAHVPLYVNKAKTTHVVVGHPVVADERGKDITINVVHVFDNPHQWHISVNNLTDKSIITKLSQAMELPGFNFEEREITLAPGEYKILSAKAKRK
jgi:hypothetical protein